MAPYAREHFGNASAIHVEGQHARDAIEHARARCAEVLRTRNSEVFFTSGGTESNNLAISGALEHALCTRAPEACEVVTTAIEHPSVMGVLARYAARGVVVHQVPVSEDGRISLSTLTQLISPRTILVTCAYANSEIGVVQDVKAIARIVRAHRATVKSVYPLMHLDASQAPLYLPCACDSLGVDLLTLDAAKCYGPKGVGVLVKKQHAPIAPLFAGGDQEEGLRPGTENTALIVGFAEAFVRAQRTYVQRAQKLEKLRDYGIEEILRSIPGAVVNGSQEHRIANNINISIPGIEGEYAAVVLDHHGFAVSTKSACSGASGSGSAVIYALGGDDARALSTVRITLGEETTKRNIYACIRVLQKHVAFMRAKFDQIQKK